MRLRPRPSPAAPRRRPPTPEPSRHRADRCRNLMKCSRAPSAGAFFMAGAVAFPPCQAPQPTPILPSRHARALCRAGTGRAGFAISVDLSRTRLIGASHFAWSYLIARAGHPPSESRTVAAHGRKDLDRHPAARNHRVEPISPPEWLPHAASRAGTPTPRAPRGRFAPNSLFAPVLRLRCGPDGFAPPSSAGPLVAPVARTVRARV